MIQCWCWRGNACQKGDPRFQNLAHQAELMSVTNRSFQNPASLWLSLIDTTTSLWLSPMRQPLYWLTWHKWCKWRNVTYRYVSQCHGVTNRCVKISKYLEWRPLLNCQRSREERISLSKLLTPTSKTVGLTFIANRARANLVSEKVYGSNLISANDPQPV